MAIVIKDLTLVGAAIKESAVWMEGQLGQRQRVALASISWSSLGNFGTLLRTQIYQVYGNGTCPVAQMMKILLALWENGMVSWVRKLA